MQKIDKARFGDEVFLAEKYCPREFAFMNVTSDSRDVLVQEFSDLASSVEVEVVAHCNPKMNWMLFLVSDCNFLILPFSRSDPHCLVRHTNLDISARLNR